jgi:rod shape-determining protein MreC
VNRRQRGRYVVLVVLLGHFVLISAQVDVQKAGSSSLEVVAFGVFSEVQSLVNSGVNGFQRFWRRYVALRNVEVENSLLRNQLSELTLRLQQERSLTSRTESLQRLLDLRKSVPLRTESARVIAVDATPYFRILTIDRGSSHGVRSDLAVVAPEGVVGRVIEPVSRRTSKVQLLVDRDAAAGARIERTRVVGVTRAGTGESPLLLDYVSNFADVIDGDVVVTSGTDGIYPKGFVIGRVTAVNRGDGLYKDIGIQPEVDFSRLEYVLVVMAPRSHSFSETFEKGASQ